jgi:hypothetical protein
MRALIACQDKVNTVAKTLLVQIVSAMSLKDENLPGSNNSDHQAQDQNDWVCTTIILMVMLTSSLVVQNSMASMTSMDSLESLQASLCTYSGPSCPSDHLLLPAALSRCCQRLHQCRCRCMCRHRLVSPQKILETHQY